MDYRGPHPRGQPPLRPPRGNHNFQPHPNNPRMLNPFPNFPANNNFQPQDDGMLYQNQPHGSIPPPPPPQPMEFPNYTHPSGYIAQNLPSPNDMPAGFQHPGFPPAWALPTAPVFLDMTQVAPMPPYIAALSPAPAPGAPPGIVAGQKFNNVDMVSTCSHCKQKNQFWLIEMTNKDDVIKTKDDVIKKMTEQFNEQIRSMQSRIRELEELNAQNQTEETVEAYTAEIQESASHEVAKSQLSPDAISFTPSVPVVSAKGITEEPNPTNQDTTPESEPVEESIVKHEPLSQTDSPVVQRPTPVSTPGDGSEHSEKHEVKSWADEAEQETATAADTKLTSSSPAVPAQLVVAGDGSVRDGIPAPKPAEENWDEPAGHVSQPRGENHGQYSQETRTPADHHRYQNQDYKQRRHQRGERGHMDRPPGFGRGKPAYGDPGQYQNRTFEEKRSYPNQNNSRHNDSYRRNSGPRENQKKDNRENMLKDSNAAAQSKHSDDVGNETSNNLNNASGDATENWRVQGRNRTQQGQRHQHRENQGGSYQGSHASDQQSRGPTPNFDQQSRVPQYNEQQNKPYQQHQQGNNFNNHQHGNNYNNFPRPQHFNDQQQLYRLNNFNPGNNHGNYGHPPPMQPYPQQAPEYQGRGGSNFRGLYRNSRRGGPFNQHRGSRNRESGDYRQSGNDLDSNAGGEQNLSKTYVPKDVVEQLKGDLFTAPKEFSLAHCVGKDFRMSSGIAVKFRSEFKQIAELMDQNVDVGGCAHIKDPQHNRYIFYLVTKSMSNGKPTIDNLQRSLESMRDKCKELEVTKLAMPRIGCGLDSLIWDEVKYRINEVFKNENIQVRVYDFNAPPYYYKNNKRDKMKNYNYWRFQTDSFNDLNSDNHSLSLEDFNYLPECFKPQWKSKVDINVNDNLLDTSRVLKFHKGGPSISEAQLGSFNEQNTPTPTHPEVCLEEHKNVKVITDESDSDSQIKKKSKHSRKGRSRDKGSSRKSKKDKTDDGSILKTKHPIKKRKKKNSEKVFYKQELEGKHPQKEFSCMDLININYGSSNEELGSDEVEQTKFKKVKRKIGKKSNESGKRVNELTSIISENDKDQHILELKSKKVENVISEKRKGSKKRKRTKIKSSCPSNEVGSCYEVHELEILKSKMISDSKRKRKRTESEYEYKPPETDELQNNKIENIVNTTKKRKTKRFEINKEPQTPSSDGDNKNTLSDIRPSLIEMSKTKFKKFKVKSGSMKKKRRV